MNKVLTTLAISLVVLTLALPLTFGQGQGAPPQDRPQAPPAQAAEKTFSGQLTKVDANAKMITVKGASEEMAFEYTDATQVSGSEKTIQGLAGKTGAELKVSYRDAGGKHQATKIETIEKR
jgi:hypothetical protein